MIIKVGNENFELSDAEIKAAEWDMLSIKEWIENAIRNKARQCMDQITIDHSNKQPKKITRKEKESIVRAANIKSAKQQQVEIEAKILNNG